MSKQYFAETPRTKRSAVILVPRSKIPDSTHSELVARSAGRCEFCNVFLYRHPLTGERGNFAEDAHIVAFSERGPRGEEDRPADINNIDNLMLLCRPDHKLIDDNEERYTRPFLELRKREHEARIQRVTEYGPGTQTTVLQLKVKIGSQVVEVDRTETFEALFPRYAVADPHIIDLTGLGDEEPGAFYKLAADRIRRRAALLYEAGSDLERTRHLSVLALAPIPLLVQLGNSLSNKVATDFYQCHRTRPENRWNWYEGAPPARFEQRRLRSGTDPAGVGLILSLSGAIDIGSLPAHVDERFSVYEISPVDAVPSTGLLRQKEDLEAFRAVYRNALAELRRKHPGLKVLHVFPALPAPAAVTCGFDMLPKVDPELRIYDNVKTEGGFVERLSVNAHEQQ